MSFLSRLRTAFTPASPSRTNPQYSARLAPMSGLGQSAFAMSGDMMVGLALGALAYVVYRKKVKKDL